MLRLTRSHVLKPGENIFLYRGEDTVTTFNVLTGFPWLSCLDSCKPMLHTEKQNFTKASQVLHPPGRCCDTEGKSQLGPKPISVTTYLLCGFAKVSVTLDFFIWRRWYSSRLKGLMDFSVPERKVPTGYLKSLDIQAPCIKWQSRGWQDSCAGLESMKIWIPKTCVKKKAAGSWWHVLVIPAPAWKVEPGQKKKKKRHLLKNDMRLSSGSHAGNTCVPPHTCTHKCHSIFIYPRYILCTWTISIHPIWCRCCVSSCYTELLGRNDENICTPLRNFWFTCG